MLTAQDIRGLASGSMEYKQKNRVEISFKDLNTRVVDKIKESMLEISLESEDFSKIARDVITDYVYTKKPYVEGYVRDGRLMVKTLTTDLHNNITSWGKLTRCRDEVKIREIQINGEFIFVDLDNGYELLRDNEGNIIKFDNPEEGLNFIKARLIASETRFTVEEPLVNAMTVEGFRIAATAPVINPPHPDTPTERWATAVIRKLGGLQFDTAKLVNNNTACEPMLDWIALTYEALLGHIVAGTTGCGKTTIQEYGMKRVRDRDRVVSIQSPTEYHYRNIVDGVMKNNAVYWEVDPDARKDTTRSASLDNLVSHTLRYTANMDMIGELKDTTDYASAARAINAGTKISSSLHTFDIPGILDRFALELVNALQMDLNIARELACRYLGPLTLCDRLGDGSRKIMGCAEVTGYDRVHSEYLLNYLYEFILVDTIPREGEEGKLGLVWNVGYFVKRGNPAISTQNTILKQLPRERIQRVLDVPMGTVLKEVNFDKLPKDYVITYDSDITPHSDTEIASVNRREEDNVGIQI